MTIDEELAAIDEALARKGGGNPPAPLSAIDLEIAEIDDVLRNRSQKPKAKAFNWPRFMSEQLAQGTMGLGDIVQLMSQVNPNMIAASNYADWDPNMTNEGPISTQSNLMAGVGNLQGEPISESIHKGGKRLGVDIKSQGEGNTPLQRIAGAAARGLGAAPFGIAPALLSGAQSAGSQGLKEARVPPLVAEAASLLGTMGVSRVAGSIKNAIKGKSLSGAEEKVAHYLQGTMSQKEKARAIKKLEEQMPELAKSQKKGLLRKAWEWTADHPPESVKHTPKYPITGYEPMTAEIIESPTASQLHNLRYGTAGSGLPEKTAMQNQALNSALEKNTLNKISNEGLQGAVTGELAKRQNAKYSVTNPLYEELKQIESPLSMTNAKQYVANSKVRGNLRNDINYIKKQIQPEKKLTPQQISERKKYIKEKEFIKNNKAYEPHAKEKLLAKLEKPEPRPKLTVAEAEEAKEAITSRIQEYKNTPQKKRLRILNEGKAAIEKDLEQYPLAAKASAEYRRLSKPVNEILEHPEIKLIPKSRSDRIFDSLYNDKSHNNIKQLKKVIGDNPQEWEAVQHATIDLAHRKIGNVNELSYPKLNNFMKKYRGALQETLTPDQMAFMEELRSALHGKNLSFNLGQGKGSQTYERLANDMGLKAGLGVKATEAVAHFLPNRLGGAPLKFFLNRWIKNRSSDVWAAMDSALTEPEVMHKLLNHEFKSQSEFNKYMAQMMSISEQRRKENEKKVLKVHIKK